jgi:hypothetical protein
MPNQKVGAEQQGPAPRFSRHIDTVLAGQGWAAIRRDPMTVRTSRKTVTFTRPFSVSGIDEMQRPGTYVVETDEELLPDLSFPAYRRVATLLWLRSQPGHAMIEQVVNIDPLELEAAQARDASSA